MVTRERHPIVTRRLVFHLPGYDPPGPAAVHKRAARELRRFEETWSVAATMSEPVIGEETAVWSFDASGPNWHTASEFVLLRWDDVVVAQGRDGGWRRFPRGVFALLEFLFAGVLRRYLRTSWPYGLFFLYPLVLLVLLAAGAALAGYFAGRLSGSALIGAGVFVLAGAGLAVWAGSQLRLDHLLDDWIFALDYLRREHPIIGPRLDRFAREVVERARAGQPDEIAIVGHSLGAVLAIDLVDRVLRLEPSLAATRLTLVTLGSSALKIGLHPGAGRFRAAVERVASSASVFWVEYQARTDVMNFYGPNPVAAMGLPALPIPVVRKVSIEQMLHPQVYKRIRTNFYRVHYQFISGNDRRAPYDYFMLVLGPLPIEAQARSKDGVMTAFASNGSLLDGAGRPGRPKPARHSVAGDLP